MKTKLAVLSIIAIAASLGTQKSDATSNPQRIVCLGDSMIVGFNSASCDDIVECIGDFGEHYSNSYCDGSAIPSMKQLMGATSSRNHGKAGATWVGEGNSQSTTAHNAGGGHTVVIGLGGNDLLKRYRSQIPSTATFATTVDQVLAKHVNASASTRPANVIVMSIPDVNLLEGLMRYQKNAVFETCQGMWDDFKGPVRRDLKTCEVKWYNPLSWLCPVADWIGKLLDWKTGLKNLFLSGARLFGSEPHFPGKVLLGKYASQSDKDFVRNQRNAFNNILAQKATVWNDNGNGVRVVYASSVGQTQFTTGDVSAFDCFHPSVQGQKKIAKTLYNEVNGIIFAIGVYAGSGGAGGDVANGSDTTPPKLANNWSGSWASSSELRQEVSSLAGNSSDDSGAYSTIDIWAQNAGHDSAYNCAYYTYGCYLGKMRAETVNHAFSVHFSDPYGNPDPAYYYDYWRTFVRPIDRAGNRGSIYTGPWY